MGVCNASGCFEWYKASVGNSVVGVLMIEAFGARSTVTGVVAISVLAELHGVWSTNVDGVVYVTATRVLGALFTNFDGDGDRLFVGSARSANVVYVGV